MRVVLGILFAAALSASTRAQPATDPSATRPVSFAKIAARIPAGTAWAHLQYGYGLLGCHDDQVLTWDASNNANLETSEYERVFREGLTQAGFHVAGDPTNLFEEDLKASDLQIGAAITGLEATFCATERYLGQVRENDRYQLKGAATMRIEWQVYSTAQARVLARIPTSATYELKTWADGGNILILQRAFSANVAQLTASDSFRSALAAPVAAAPALSAAPRGPLAIALRSADARTPLDQAAKGVVSIFAGGGMGSGVLISKEGYILTNYHVAGDSGQVRVHWPDGSETVGEVVRADRRRDVALVKTVAKAQPLAVRSAPATLGETVFAIGTPLDRRLEGTLTRGVVSTATRMFEGQLYIQSDVGVAHGNSGGPLLDEMGAVIGLTDLGLYAEESKSLNLFIPIGDALRALAVKPAG